jgi:hypothetical protein
MEETAQSLIYGTQPKEGCCFVNRKDNDSAESLIYGNTERKEAWSFNDSTYVPERVKSKFCPPGNGGVAEKPFGTCQVKLRKNQELTGKVGSTGTISMQMPQVGAARNGAPQSGSQLDFMFGNGAPAPFIKKVGRRKERKEMSMARSTPGTYY